MYKFKHDERVQINRSTPAGRTWERMLMLDMCNRAWISVGWACGEGWTRDLFFRYVEQYLWPSARLSYFQSVISMVGRSSRTLLLLAESGALQFAPRRERHESTSRVLDAVYVRALMDLRVVTGLPSPFTPARMRALQRGLRNALGPAMGSSRDVLVRLPLAIGPARPITSGDNMRITGFAESVSGARQLNRRLAESISEMRGLRIPLIRPPSDKFINSVLLPGPGTSIPPYVTGVKSDYKLSTYQFTRHHTMVLPRAKPRKVKGRYVRDIIPATATA